MVKANKDINTTHTHTHTSLYPNGPHFPSCLEISLHQDKVKNFPSLAETKDCVSLLMHTILEIQGRL